jgi:hypothetical protein
MPGIGRCTKTPITEGWHRRHLVRALASEAVPTRDFQTTGFHRLPVSDVFEKDSSYRWLTRQARRPKKPKSEPGRRPQNEPRRPRKNERRQPWKRASQLGLAIIFAIASPAFAQDRAAPRCPPGLVVCSPGGTGGGGCYRPGSAICQDGQICDNPLSVCRRGPNGPGGCYNVGQYVCRGGRIDRI